MNTYSYNDFLKDWVTISPKYHTYKTLERVLNKFNKELLAMLYTSGNKETLINSEVFKLLEKYWDNPIKKANTKKFKVGNYVKIVRKASEGEGDWGNAWVPSMDEFIGTIQKVKGLVGNNGYELLDSYNFPEFVLEKVLDKAPEYIIVTSHGGNNTSHNLSKDVAYKGNVLKVIDIDIPRGGWEKKKFVYICEGGKCVVASYAREATEEEINNKFNLFIGKHKVTLDASVIFNNSKISFQAWLSWYSELQQACNTKGVVAVELYLGELRTYFYPNNGIKENQKYFSNKIGEVENVTFEQIEQITERIQNGKSS